MGAIFLGSGGCWLLHFRNLIFTRVSSKSNGTKKEKGQNHHGKMVDSGHTPEEWGPPEGRWPWNYLGVYQLLAAWLWLQPSRGSLCWQETVFKQVQAPGWQSKVTAQPGCTRKGHRMGADSLSSKPSPPGWGLPHGRGQDVPVQTRFYSTNGITHSVCMITDKFINKVSRVQGT